MNYNFNMSKIYMNKLEAKIKDLEKENKNLKEDFKRHIDRINELTNRVDKAIETINLMIYKGYTISNKETARSYMATSENSEFGVRAKELLDILKGKDE